MKSLCTDLTQYSKETAEFLSVAPAPFPWRIPWLGCLSLLFHGEAVNKSMSSGLCPSGKASVPYSDHSLPSQRDKASLPPLSTLLVSRLSPLSREGSPHQGAEEGTWSGSCGLKMKWEWVNCAVRAMLKDDSSVQMSAAALRRGSPRKSIPQAVHRLTVGNWRNMTDLHNSLGRKTFNLRKIRSSQLPLTRAPV